MSNPIRPGNYVCAYASGMDGDATRKALSLRLKAAREAKKLTQEQVAVECGVINGTVSAWEHARGVPDALRLGELAALYAVSTDWLLTGESKADFSDAIYDLAQALEKIGDRSLRDRALTLCWQVVSFAQEGKATDTKDDRKVSNS
jgi:transcriptional regulator with XRE-family HTH domain